MSSRAGFVLLLLAAAAAGEAAPTGLNIIPTTDIVPVNSWIGAIQNSNDSFTGTPFYRQPLLSEQTQFGLESWLEAGLDCAPTPDFAENQGVFNLKALVRSEDDRSPNVALGMWNITQDEVPGYYLTMSKTLNYAQEQEERFRAHHRRNRKLLGRRIHFGMMLTSHGHGILEPFAGTDLQLSENAVFQADWVSGAGSSVSAGISYVLWDQRTVLNPAILFANDGSRINGIQINISHQFNL